MGFKFSQHRGGHWVCGNQPWDSSFPNIGGGGGIRFVVTSHGIQVFPTTGGIGFVVTSHGIQVFPNIGGHGFVVTSHGIQVFPTSGGALRLW